MQVTEHSAAEFEHVTLEIKTPGQLAYELDVSRRPRYHDRTPRKAWHELRDWARDTWERNPTARW